MAAECNSRELKFNNHVYLFIFYERRNAQEINRQLLGTGHTWGWLQNAKAGSRSSAMMYTSVFSSRVRIAQEKKRQLVITRYAWGLLWNAIAGS